MLQRIRQFVTAGREPTPAELELAQRFLSPKLYELFLQQHPRDICHGAATARWLLARGYDDPDLIAAALLHDVAKGNQRRLDRAAYVVATWFRLARRLACATSRFELRRAAERSLRHAERGADLLACCGAPARVVELTRRHHEPPGGDAMLALLQQADAAS